MGARIFLLSPAALKTAAGTRAWMLVREGAEFELARRVRAGGAPLGEVFAFLSGLYFRGKLAYAERFGMALVITALHGLVPADTVVTREWLLAQADVDLAEDPRFVPPLVASARMVAERFPQVVLLGSVASTKYTRVLLEVFGDGLLFPPDFVGRGDMSRGGLLLRAVRSGLELPYERVRGAVVNGKRPPRLAPVKGILRDAMGAGKTDLKRK